MPASTLDSILNTVMPIAIFAVLGFLIYKNFKVEIDQLIFWIKAKMADDEGKKQYQPHNNIYMTEGTITYR